MFLVLFWGQTLACLVYAGNDGGPAIGAIYQYAMDPLNFRTPALVGVQPLLQELDVSARLASLSDAQLAQALPVAIVLAPFSTSLSMVWTLFVTGSSLVDKVPCGSLGAKACPVGYGVSQPDFRMSELSELSCGSTNQQPMDKD